MSQDLRGIWKVYRYNVSRHVFKAPVTELEILKPPPPDEEEVTCLAKFDLDGFDLRMNVVMDKAGAVGGPAPMTDTWFGEYENFDFRWDHYKNEGLLIGYAADRHYLVSRDAFVAVKSSSTPPFLPEPFAQSFLTPLVRTRPAQKGTQASSIDLASQTIVLDGTSYPITDVEHPPEGGIKLRAKFANGTNELWLRLWLPPIDEPQRQLAIGYQFEYHDNGDPTVPEDPMCGFTALMW